MKGFIIFLVLLPIILITSYFAVKRLNLKTTSPIPNNNINVMKPLTEGNNNSSDIEKSFNIYPHENKITNSVVEKSSEPGKKFVLPKLDWQTYTHKTLNLEFKFPSNYFEVWEKQQGIDTCIYLGEHKNWVPSMSICYIYSKDQIEKNIDFFNNPLKYREPENYHGVVTKTAFKGNEALLMVDDSPQQVPVDTMEILIEDNDTLSHLVQLTYLKADIEKYLKYNNETWDSNSINEEKTIYNDVIKVIIDSIIL